MNLHFNSIGEKDIEEIRALQPKDWGDIIPEIKFYIKHDFCFPVKALSGGKIVGIGASIIFGKTAWLAHIIVHPELRNKGIGYAIVEFLLKDLQSKTVETSLLIATELGKPVYEKAGFTAVSEYLFLKREETRVNQVTAENIHSYSPEMYETIMKMDQRISGENRDILLKDHIEKALVLVQDGQLQGFYLPSLREGPIYAENEQAGLELMKLKYASSDIAVIPTENMAGLAFLKQTGFKETDKKGVRMVLGKHISWQADKVFSRIGGNYG